jgi:UDP-glucose:(heptosyl)LPS alpha-1,3-glucosyltransferase
LPRKGGCETYITDLTRRLVRDGHEVHLYAWDWDANAIPVTTHCHRVDRPRFVPRPLRPWLFSSACRAALSGQDHDLTIGFDKVLGVDLHYPQGGLYRETIRHNARIHPPGLGRWRAVCRRWFDPGYWSFLHLEWRQYRQEQALVVVNSQMVRRHARDNYALDDDRMRVVHSAIDPMRFHATNRLALRSEMRRQWGVHPQHAVGLFAATNYPLKGLAPLLRSLPLVDEAIRFRLAVVGSANIAPYQALARQLGIVDRVQFVGYCTDMKRAYYAADFLVHPTFYDPCSLVVLEALACGLPIITTR